MSTPNLTVVAFVSAQGLLRHHLGRRLVPQDARRQLVTLQEAQTLLAELETRAELAEQAHVSAAEERDHLRAQVARLQAARGQA